MSKEGDGLGIMAKLLNEGHDVRVWLPDAKFEYASLGLLERSSNWRHDAAEWADLVVSDMVGLGKYEQVLQEFKVLYIGFNPMADVLELDRDRQMKALRKFGLQLPETLSFDTPAQARDLAGLWGSNVKGFVLKPSGNIETAGTRVVKQKEMLEWALDQYSGDQELVAQRFIDGVEISTEGWFNGKTWMLPFNHTMEEKRFLAGDVGPNTGCMGNVVWPIANPDRDAFVKELKKLTPLLRTIQYKGPIDLNVIANKDGLWTLELTTRFGYDAIEALHGLLKEPFGMLLMETAMGTKGNMSIEDAFGVAVRLSVPPYPHADPSKHDRGQPVLGLSNADPNHFLTDVYVEKNKIYWSASDGVIAKITGTGATLKAARRAAYKNVAGVKASGLQYRIDIGERVEADLKQLRAWRYI